MSKRYSVIRNYKKFKKEYLYFIVFIKYGNEYYTFDSDAKIMMYMFNKYNQSNRYIINKDDFKSVLEVLLNNGINVVLAGWKNAREYYPHTNKYMEIKRISKYKYKEQLLF